MGFDMDPQLPNTVVSKLRGREGITWHRCDK